MIENADRLLKIIVGSRFGEYPTRHLSVIRAEKHERAANVARLLDLKEDDHVLEIGAGCGWSAQVLAPSVKSYILTDISPDFLKIAEGEVQGLKNVQIERMEYGRISHYKYFSPTAILALDVFTQFSFYDYVVYLKGVFDALAPGGRFYFNFMNAQFLDVGANEKLLRHEDIFLNDRQSAPLLLHWMEPQTIERMARDVGFKVFQSYFSENHSWYLLEKDDSP